LPPRRGVGAGRGRPRPGGRALRPPRPAPPRGDRPRRDRPLPPPLLRAHAVGDVAGRGGVVGRPRGVAGPRGAAALAHQGARARGVRAPVRPGRLPGHQGGGDAARRRAGARPRPPPRGGRMSGDWLGPLMFVAALALIFSGYPVAFALGGTALVFAFVGVEAGYFDWPYLLAMADRTFGVMANTVLLAVPFFIFMGTVLEKSRLAEDLLTTIGALFGPRRGGLAFAVVFVGTLLAAATGVVGASVVAMGLISLPVMLRYGYSRTLSTGVIMASGTLGQIIPPSVVLIVLADQMGVSVGALFVGALAPGLVLAGLYAAYVGYVAWRHPGAAPAL